MLEAVKAVAARHDVKPIQVALAWLLQKDGVAAPIIGASKESYIDDAVEALAIQLSKKDIEMIEAPYVPHPILGHAGSPNRPDRAALPKQNASPASGMRSTEVTAERMSGKRSFLLLFK